MKNVLIFCRAYPPSIGGGGEISTKMLAEKLSEFGYQINVVAVNSVKEYKKESKVIIYKIPYRNLYWSLEKKNSKIVKLLWHCIDSNNIFMKKQLNQLLDDINPDIIITSTIEDISSIVWKIASAKQIRIIHILRSYSLLCVNANMYKNENCNEQCGGCKILTYPKKFNSKYVTDVIGISQYILDKHIANGYFPNALQNVIYNMCLDDKIDTKKYEGRNNDDYRIGYIGRIHITKGIELLLEAINNIKESSLCRRITVMIAGDGDEEYIHTLKTIAYENKINAVFLGNMNANEFLDTIDLLVVPSLWQEPFGRVVIESLGRKVPVAAKSSGGIPELLENNKNFLFNSSEQLANIIVMYFNFQIEFKFDTVAFETETTLSKWSSLLR